MTQEQDNALKVIEKLISDMKCHVLSTEEIMILIKGIMSNDCGNSCYTPVYIPNHQETSPNISPGEIYCRTNQNPNLELYSTTCTTTLEELPNHFKGENEMIEEYRKKILIKDGNLEIW
jgi:hypothetical protein